MALLKRPNGTEDILPGASSDWQTLEKFLRDTADTFGFSEIRVPTFEQTELFSRGVGETTDVVQKEMYTVSARESTFTLRPEGTAGTIRAILQNGLLNEALPQRVYYILSCFRHERPQAGRLREFHQFGVEMAGSASPYADAEVILLGKTVLDTLGLKDIVLNINSIGCPTCRAKYQEALKAYFEPHRAELCETCQERLVRNPMRLLDCKSAEDQAIAKDAPVILDYLCEECKEHFEAVKSALTDMGVDYIINPKIVRGLDYYTKTVFEFITTSIGAQGTVCAGGRYDGLIEQLGGQHIPALGFGMGLERLILTMEQQGCLFMEQNKCEVYLAPMDDSARPAALRFASALRQMGIRAEFDLLGRTFKAQMKYANKIQTKYLIVLGSNELEQGSGMLKNMQSGEQKAIRLDSVDHFTEDYTNISLSEML